ncbi:hypothetical protein LLEC1_01701 [Akanthomyces lecanii]|uniref:Major facilitator superfamily (MFS) profile domain-containing protein n=1 Tax=Cordyceps confragosa TaxID=2714763 RepID=A0A179IB54_CORDF|nr:hypothetical protein LLEC1_01701 [Akanthomyces lecanii]
MSNNTPDYGTIPCNATPGASTSVSAYNDTERELLRKDTDTHPTLPLLQTCTIMLSLSGAAFCSSMTSGLLTVCLPGIAVDLIIPEHLLLCLACGCCLLLAGSIADKVGDRSINLIGTATVAIAVLANGRARDGIGLIIFRAIQGLGAAMSLPTGVSIIARSLAPGRSRNIGFACLGVAQSLGYSIGLIVGGIVQEAVNWRLGYYVCAPIIAAFVVAAWTSIPPNKNQSVRTSLLSLITEIDWIGIVMLSMGFGLLSYTCAVMTRDATLLMPTLNMIAMAAGLLLIMASPRWMSRQVRLGRPALIPNSIWANRAFAAISLTVFLAWASLQSSELLASLFFQRVQLISPLEASIKLLPNVLTGFIVNLSTGLTVQYFASYKLMALASVVATVSPVIMAVIDPAWSYWVAGCWAVALAPVSIDGESLPDPIMYQDFTADLAPIVLFTIAHIVITDVFPADMHALAGGVFNTVSQLGTSLGMSLVAIVSNAVINGSEDPDKESPEA